MCAQEEQEGGSRKLLASQLHLSPWENNRTYSPGSNFQAHKGQECEWEQPNRFTKQQSHLTSLTALYDEITGSVD